jgi:hypothetical protein
LSKLSPLMPRVRTLQYVLIAVVAFSLGGATVVQAVAPSGILGTVRLADRTDETRLAAVDADGNVQVKVNNLSATQQVSGTVSVSNFPATQNVNITGGTVSTRPSVATRTVRRAITVSAGESETVTFTAINASFIQVKGEGIVRISGSIGEVVLFDEDDEHIEIAYTQRVPVDDIFVACNHTLLDCFVVVNIVGD